MRRNLLILLLSVPSLLMAQSDLTFEGKVVAHDVNSNGPMPAALRTLLAERKVALDDASIRIIARDRSQRPSRKVVLRQPKDYAPAEPVEPLLPSIRAQEEPYNLYCPYYKFDDGSVNPTRCLSGCVATSLEQILAYYRYPEALLDTLHGWDNGHYALDDLLPGTRFDWDNYLTDYRQGWTQAQGEAIALTTLAAGMAVHMNYGPHSSGANTFNAVEPLRRAFGYGMVRYFDRVLYTPGRWHAMLQHELTHGRPIAYVGHNMEMNGHAFNIDGIDTNGFYHLNWGYDGYYDGWYDLDWLNPWEPVDTLRDGMAEGFFCNQGALFMHPSSDAKVLEVDSLDLDHLGIQLKSVSLLRQPDTQGFAAADFHFVNLGQDTVTYTYEVMSYLPTDTAIFYQADYVGLAAITLAPSEERTQRLYLKFAEPGSRILGISHDDVTIPFTMPVEVIRGAAAKVEWGTVGVEVVPLSSAADGADAVRYAATFSVPVSNVSSGYASRLVTFCLYPDGGENEDLRHYHVMELPAGESEVLKVTFKDLLPDTPYHFLVRYPWPIQAQTDFRTPSLTDVHAVEADAAKAHPRYDLSGRRQTTTRRGLYIQDGRVKMQP